MPQAWHQERAVLQVEDGVRQPGGVGGQAAAIAGGREPASESYWPRRCWTTRCSRTSLQKMVRPWRTPVADNEVNQRRECRAIGWNGPRSATAARRADDGAPRLLLRELANSTPYYYADGAIEICNRHPNSHATTHAGRRDLRRAPPILVTYAASRPIAQLTRGGSSSNKASRSATSSRVRIW